jgi:hypothetical protein
MKHNRRRTQGKARKSSSVLDRINRNAAGIDCDSAEHFVAVPPDRDANPVQSFKTFTSDLLRLADWLTACGVTSVAMEATGVYWIPVFEILEARGFEVLLVNARHLKNVPGAEERRVGLRVDTRAPQRRLVARELSPGQRDRRAPRLSPSSANARGECRHVHPAHAESAHADEPPITPGGQRHYRGDRPAHLARYRRRTPRPCGSRIRCQAATGSWTRFLQWETQRTWLKLAGDIVCRLANVSGVWPSNEA